MSIWNLAADTFDFDDVQIEKVVYANHSVDKFMQATNSMGISACKGMGKTFLLKAKRLSLNKKNSNCVLPKDQLVDTPGPIVLNHSQIKFFSSYSNWVAIWIFCISAYILSQDEFKDIIEDEYIQDIPSELQIILTTKNDGVFFVLNRLLIKQNTEILRKAIESSGFLFQLLQRINRHVILFVDKLEEPFNRGFYKIEGSSTSSEGKYNSSIWAYAQVSFAEAVYVLYSGRHHIKIYYSIRQEALYGAENITTEYTKIYREMISKIEYSFIDLQKMFAKYVSLEEDQNLYSPQSKLTDPAMALCGIQKLTHRSGKIENFWDYLYRHSFGRPRDIMEMCLCLYENIVTNRVEKEEDRIRVCRHWVNQISTRICKEYLHGLEPFMGADDNIMFTQTVEAFLSNLPTNVFTFNAVCKYCHCTNKNNSMHNCTNCNHLHFFSTLYNIGLLGYIYKSQSEDGYKNSIKHIGDCVFTTSVQTLPKGELYYAHPGLSNMIQELREKSMRNYVNSNIIINSAEIFIDKKQLLRLTHLSNALLSATNEKKRVFITSTERHMRDERKKVAEILETNGYEVFAFERPNFPPIPINKNGKGATHDHCIDVALTCNSLIYIFDSDFGGEYSGNDYKQYIEEEPSITIKPSVSFVEYLVAKKFNKDVKIYVLKSVEVAKGEYVANGKPATYKSFAVDSPNASKICDQLILFNKLGNGTWYNTYTDMEELEKYIEAAFPPESSDDYDE